LPDEPAAAICLKEPLPALFSSLPALNRRAAGQEFALYANSKAKELKALLPTLLDFAPDEACRFPASPENGFEFYLR